MADPGKDDPERAVEREVHELERDIDELEGHIEKAHRQADVRADEASDEGQLVDVVGDWEGKARTDQDPSGVDLPDEQRPEGD